MTISNKTDPEIVYAGDPRVRVILGPQPEPRPGERIRVCRHVVSDYIDGRCMLLHTLTRRALLLPPSYLQYWIPGTELPDGILSDSAAGELYRHYFLVTDSFDEAAVYRDIKEILRLKEEIPEGIQSYVILPTTACNARCFYCFEKDMRYQSMSPETEEDVVRYILGHLPANRKLHIHWFGGEPLIGADIIDRISCRLLDAGVDLDSEMTSNGSLFDDDLVKRAVSVWKLKTVQITLDGREEEYLRRKQYLPSVKAPYPTVLANIHRLLAAGVEVKIRLNLDKDNVGELMLCVDELAEEFPPGEREKLTVYCHSLMGCGGCGPEGDLEEYVRNVEDYIGRKGLAGIKDISPMLRLNTTCCMADRAEHAAVISPDGSLYTCEGMPENLHYGDVKGGVADEVRYAAITGQGNLPDSCLACAFLPECTDFLLCPNREEYPVCREHMEEKLSGQMKILYAFHQERHRKKAEDGKNVPD